MADRGRPRKPEQDRRIYRLSVKCTQTEYERLVQRAKDNGLSLSDYVRKLAQIEGK